jgi:peptide/nickel transport system ATP-binding protein
MVTPALAVDELHVGFRDGSGEVRPLLRGIDIDVRHGDALGIVGESGAGKSTLVLALLGSLRPGCVRTGGAVRLDGRDLFSADPAELRKLRGRRIALVPQDAGQSLTPTMRVEDLIRETLALGEGEPDRGRAVELLEMVQLPDPESMLRRYPHQLSGGQQQRVAVALALANRPQVLLLDEPTTGLDVTTQARLLSMLRELRRTTSLTTVVISHDLGTVGAATDRIVVMYAGEVVEAGATSRVLGEPSHPYTAALLAAVPSLSGGGLPRGLEGASPRAGFSPPGCAFRTRCPFAIDACASTPPVRREADGGLVRCHLGGEPLVQRQFPVRRREPAATPGDRPVLQLAGVALSYDSPGLTGRVLGRPPAPPAVTGISFAVGPGETVALIGESGSGKSTIVRAIAGLLAPRAGTIHFNGSRLAPDAKRRSASDRRRIQLIFQNPDASLNPRHTVRQLLAQPLHLYQPGPSRDHERRSLALLDQVRLPAGVMDRYPRQLSGGEKQRVAIARAFAADPDLILCDEITSSLDVSVQAAILELLVTLQQEHGVAYLVVAHDLAVVRAIADRVLVLDRGRICESGPSNAVFTPPHHPYTSMLLASTLEPGQPLAVLPMLAGDLLPAPVAARGCPFRDRCPYTLGDPCAHDPIPAQMTSDGKSIACHLSLSTLLPHEGRKISAAIDLEVAR